MNLFLPWGLGIPVKSMGEDYEYIKKYRNKIVPFAYLWEKPFNVFNRLQILILQSMYNISKKYHDLSGCFTEDMNSF